MIKYALACDKGHQFESWFQSFDAFDKQAKRKLVACPACGSVKVEKSLMAPRLSGTKKKGRAGIDARPAEAAAPAAASDPAPVAIVSEQERAFHAKLKELRVSDIVGDKGIQGSDLGTLTLAGGGIAAFGAIIALATHLMVFDITGGIIATVGVGLVALALLWKRTGIVSEFRQKLSKSRTEFRDRLNGEIAQIFDKLFLEIEHQLKEPLARLDKQGAHLSSLAEEAERISIHIERL